MTAPSRLESLHALGSFRDPGFSCVRDDAEFVRALLYANGRPTDDKFRWIEPFVVHRVVSGDDQHAFDPVARPLLAEGHLKDGVLDRLASHLSTQQVELARRDLEIGCRIFVLANRWDVKCHGYKIENRRTHTHTSVATFLAFAATGFFLTASNTLRVSFASAGRRAAAVSSLGCVFLMPGVSFSAIHEIGLPNEAL